MTEQITAPEVRTVSLGPMDNNVYILSDPASGRGVVVDASHNAQRIADAAAGLRIERILLTHGDADHVDALEDLKRLLNAPVGVHPADADRLPSPPDFLIEDGVEITFGACSLRAMHTPGHTPGSVGFYTPGVLVAGDTLFPGGPGATGDDAERFATIMRSLREKFFTLPDETDVLPGHGTPTTIGDERPSLDDWEARGY